VASSHKRLNEALAVLSFISFTHTHTHTSYRSELIAKMSQSSLAQLTNPDSSKDSAADTSCFLP
jgi:hypothetical protein